VTHNVKSIAEGVILAFLSADYWSQIKILKLKIKIIVQ